MADDASRGRGLAQLALAALAAAAYLLLQGALPDETWAKARPIAALGLGATLLGLAVDAGRSLTGVAPALGSPHRRHRSVPERLTDPAFEEADGAIRAFVDDGVLTPAYERLFVDASDGAARSGLLREGAAAAGTRPRGTRPLLAALLSGAALVAGATAAALGALPDAAAGPGARIVAAVGVYGLQVRAVTAGSRLAVAVLAAAGALLMHLALGDLLGLGAWPSRLHGALLVPLGMLALGALVAATMGRTASISWDETRRRLRRDTAILRRRAIAAVGIGLLAALLKGLVGRLLGFLPFDPGALLSAALVAWWGYAAYVLLELAGAHLALSGTTREAERLRHRRLDVHASLLRLSVGDDRRRRARMRRRPLA